MRHTSESRESCASDTVHRCIALAEIGLLLLVKGLVRESLCFVQFKAAFALRA